MILHQCILGLVSFTNYNVKSLWLLKLSFRILFGCSENTHRTMNELEARIPKMTDIFPLGPTHCYNGLPGVLVFAAASPGQKSPMNVYGLKQVRQYLHHCNIFKKTSQMNYRFKQFQEDVSSLRNSKNLYTGEMIELADNVDLYPIIISITKDIFLGPEMSISYIGQFRPGPGKFNREKAEALGIPMNRWSTFYGGNSYKLPNGKLVCLYNYLIYEE